MELQGHQTREVLESTRWVWEIGAGFVSPVADAGSAASAEDTVWSTGCVSVVKGASWAVEAAPVSTSWEVGPM